MYNMYIITGICTCTFLKRFVRTCYFQILVQHTSNLPAVVLHGRGVAIYLTFILCDLILFLSALRCGKSDIFLDTKTVWVFTFSHRSCTSSAKKRPLI